MPKQLQFRRGTTAELNLETGSLAELFVDTDKKSVVVMDGALAGGYPLARESVVNASQPSVFSVNSSSTAVRITQTGTGNALVVEDSANPDSTPFVINNSGRVIIGNQTELPSGLQHQLQILATTSTAAVSASRFSADSGSAALVLLKSRSTTLGTLGGALLSGDDLGAIYFKGDDGTTHQYGAFIYAEAAANWSAGSNPGNLVFSTTAVGATSATERLRIDSAGNVGIGVTPSAWSGTSSAFQNPSGSIYSFAPGYQTGINSNAYYNGSNWVYRNTAAAADYYQQSGQHIWRTVASGTAGTAITFTQAMTLDAIGRLKIGGTSLDNSYVSLQGGTLITDQTTQHGFRNDKTWNATYITNTFSGFSNTHDIAATGTIPYGYGFVDYTLATLGGTITNYYSFAASDQTIATNNYGFWSNISAATGRWNFYAAGAANNYFAGNVGIGVATPTVKFEVVSTGAMLVPKGTTAERPTGVEGYVRYNTTDKALESFNGTTWDQPTTRATSNAFAVAMAIAL